MADTFINIPSGGAKTWKDPVPTSAQLPASNNNLGDTRVTLDTFSIYTWNGTTWILQSTGAGGVNSVTSNGSLTVTGTISDPILDIAFPILAPDGSAGAPSYSFANDTGHDTGIYTTGDGNLSFSTNGALGMFLDPSQNLTITGNITAANFPQTGSANTFAGFNGSGDLESIPGFNIDTTSGGINENLTEQPNNLGGGYSANSLNVQFQPLQDSPNDDWNIQAINVSFDSANSGFSQGTSGEAATLLNLNSNHGGTGPIGAINQIKTYVSLGNGTDPLTIKGTGILFGFGDYNDNLTIDGALQGYTFQPHVHSGALSTSSFNIQAFTDNANIEIPINGYTGFNSNPQIASINNGSNYNAFQTNPIINTLTGNAGLYGYGFYPNVTTSGANSNIVGLNMNPIITTLGTNSNYQGITIGGTVPTMGSSSNVNGFAWFPNITTSHGGINGLQINPTISGGDANFTGINVSPNGGATLNNPVGVRINLNQINSADPQGTTGLESDSRLQVNANTQLRSSQGFQIGSRIEHLYTVPIGSPVTGTDELALSFAGDFLVEDNVANGGFGIGFNAAGFISSIAVANTKTIDSATVLLAAATFPDPGSFVTGGNITDLNVIRIFPPLAQGGTANVTNLYGFKIDGGFGDFGAAATNTWGLYLDTSTAENYIGSSLAIGTATKKVSNSSIALEVESTTKAIRFPNMTTAQKLALNALSGMQVYDTDLNQMSYYNGTSWINF